MPIYVETRLTERAAISTFTAEKRLNLAEQTVALHGQVAFWLNLLTFTSLIVVYFSNKKSWKSAFCF